MGSPSSTCQKELDGVRGAETRRADDRKPAWDPPPHAGSPSPSPQRGRSPGWFRASVAPSPPPPGPSLIILLLLSCWFKTLICSFCCAMPRQMRPLTFSALYDVRRAALYMQHLVWFDAYFLHGFPLKQPGDFKKIGYTLTCLGLSLQGYKALGAGIHTQGNEGLTPPHHHAINTHTTHSWTSTLWGHSLRGCTRGRVGRKG